MLEGLKKMFGMYDMREKIMIGMLKEIDFLKIFSDSQLYEFSKKFRLKDYKSGQIIVESGTKPDFIGLLESGEIDAIIKINGKELKLGDIKGGDMFLELAYFNKTTTMAKLIAKKDCITWEVPISEFDRLIQNNPNLQKELKTIVKSRNEKNSQALQEFLKKEKQEESRKPIHIDDSNPHNDFIKINL